MKLKKFIVITLILLISICITPIAFGKTRQSYMVDYLYTTQNEDGTFGVTYQETAFALEILNRFNAYVVEDFVGVKNKVDIPALIDNFEDAIEEMFESEKVNIYNLYYLLDSLNRLESLDSSLNAGLHNEIYSYINETIQPGGGFSLTNTSSTANMISTYYVLNIFVLINEPILNQTLHRDWILSCNNTDGGFGGNQTLSSTLFTTYCAVSSISLLGYSLVDPISTLNYLAALYCSDVNNLENYGGYKPDELTDSTLISSTYYCIEAINKISSSSLHSQSSINWLIKRQNFDGGFSNFIEGNSKKTSSIIDTYYVFKSLDMLNALSILNQDIFAVEFSYTILIIVLTSIGVLIIVIFIIWRRRRV